MISLTDTDSAAIAAELVRARSRSGSPAMGMVMTLVVVADEEDADEAMKVARAASQEHPARILGVVLGDRRGGSRVDADVGIGGAGTSGERALIRLTGEVVDHSASVVLPLLLPDSPVAVWWPGQAPADPAADPLGGLGTRRITDTASTGGGRAKAMKRQCATYSPGDTDLAWTRITGWRALLAAALDQHPARVLSATVTAEKGNPSAELLRAWLRDRLRCEVTRRVSEGPGITEVALTTADGDITVSRADGRLATLAVPGQPDRPVALKRRDLPELLNEELRRLDPDDVYAATAKTLKAAHDTEVLVHDTSADLASAVADRLVDVLAAAQAEGRVPAVALTGGTIAATIHETLVGASAGRVDWSRVEVFWGDERYVPTDDPDRNARQAAESLLDHVAVDPARVHPMPSSDGGHDGLDAAATFYAEQVRAHGSATGDGAFDVMMLGVGPDGHVASLFPGHPELDVTDAIAVGVTDSPKPPPDRISLTFEALRRSRQVWFVVSGEGKAAAVARALGDPVPDKHEIPAVGVSGTDATVWFLDRASASEMPG